MKKDLTVKDPPGPDDRWVGARLILPNGAVIMIGVSGDFIRVRDCDGHLREAHGYMVPIGPDHNNPPTPLIMDRDTNYEL
jgi:hypothetical protein